MFKLCCFIPDTHLEAVKQALFAAGAGRVGDYECCAWQTKGQGQFKPLPGSQPFVGQTGTIEYVPEYKVEMICDDTVINDVIQALKTTHPYEEPAYDVWKLADL